MQTSTMTSTTFSNPRHTSHYWRAGSNREPLMIFVHGWPGLGLMWRAQVGNIRRTGLVLRGARYARLRLIIDSSGRKGVRDERNRSGHD